MLFTIIIFIITIGLLVLIHELGHYLAAKKFNIKVLEFGFGLPPRAWGKKIGETIFSLNWLPFGGFVHLLGEDDNKKENLEDNRSFASQHVLKRIAVVVAGVFMNLILAWILYTVVLASQNFQTQIPLLSEHKFVGVNQTNETVILITFVADQSPAQSVGIKAGERVIAFNDQFLKDHTELINLTKQNAGQQIKLTLTDIKKSTYRSIEVTPRVDPPAGQGALGIGLDSLQIANLDYNEGWQKLLVGPIHSWNIGAYSVDILGKTIARSFAQRNPQPVLENVAGPIGITGIVDQILKVNNPLIPYLDFIAALSLNLAVVNILPFPGLDGGRLLFLMIEAVTRKKPHPTFEKYVHTIGLFILIGLIIVITASDIFKIFV